MKNNIQEYRISLAKKSGRDSLPEISKNQNPESDFEYVHDYIDIVWNKVSTEKEAINEFDRIIHEQIEYLNSVYRKTGEYWHTILLHDSKGKRIKQES